MERISYTWRDFGICFSVALGLRRVFAGSMLIAHTLVLWWLASATSLLPLPAGISRPAFGPLGVWWLVLVALGWWWIVSRIWVALARSAAIELCADRSISIRSMRVYAFAFGKFHFRAPFVVLLLALPLWLPVLGWAALAGGSEIAATIASPFALVFALMAGLVIAVGILTLPLQAASLAVHGGDTWEGISRAAMYGTMAPQRYAMWYGMKLLMLAVAIACMALVLALALGVLALTFGLLHGMPAAYELVDVTLGIMPGEATVHLPASLHSGVTIGLSIVAIVAGGYVIAFDSASDVLVFLLLRHWCDASPVTEFFDPVRAYKEKTTRMERKEAEKALGGNAATLEQTKRPTNKVTTGNAEQTTP